MNIKVIVYTAIAILGVFILIKVIPMFLDHDERAPSSLFEEVEEQETPALFQ